LAFYPKLAESGLLPSFSANPIQTVFWIFEGLVNLTESGLVSRFFEVSSKTLQKAFKATPYTLRKPTYKVCDLAKSGLFKGFVRITFQGVCIDCKQLANRPLDGGTPHE
jgi:hypothetical protein